MIQGPKGTSSLRGGGGGVYNVFVDDLPSPSPPPTFSKTLLWLSTLIESEEWILNTWGVGIEGSHNLDPSNKVQVPRNEFKGLV